jgi:putative transposase
VSQTNYNPQEHHRRSIRLKGYDYSKIGAYFVTLAVFRHECLFGEIVNGGMRLNRFGEIVQQWWDEIPVHFPNVETWAFVLMPNHIHGIIVITDRRGTVPVPNDNQTTNQRRGEVISPCGNKNNKDGETPQMGGETPPLPTPTLGQVIAYFKYQSTKEMNTLGHSVITKFWQRNYYEHIIRNEKEMENIWKYIEMNPSRWDEDEEDPWRNL